MSEYEAVLFDLDGTLTTVSSVWQHLHESLGLWKGEAEAHRVAFENGEISYEEFCARDAKHWEGMREKDLRAIADRIPYRPGTVECVGQLERLGLLVGVVSTGLTLLAERVHSELKLAYTIANRLVAVNGRLTGEVKVNVEHGKKGEAIDLFCTQFGISHERVITVGDSEGDISMFERSGFSVAMNPASERTARSASVTHRGESLLDLMNLMPLQWSRPQ